MRDIIGAICAGICLFIGGFFLFMGVVMVIVLIAALAVPGGAATIPPEPAPPPGIVLDANSYTGKTASAPTVALPTMPEDMRCRWRPSDQTFVWRGEPDFPCSTTRGFVPVVWCPPRGAVPRGTAGGPTTPPERPSIPRVPGFGDPPAEPPTLTFTPPTDEPPLRQPPDTPAVIPLPAPGWLLLTALGGLSIAAWRRGR